MTIDINEVVEILKDKPKKIKSKKKVDLVRGYPQPNISLNADQLHSMLFDVEWDLAEKTQSLIAVLKTPTFKPNHRKTIIEALENLLDKRMNILSAQMLIDDMEKKK
tara:strand:- start:123 stop:443 length:321 start_codon:yes stop_codon:yes gene_type:complete